MLTGKMCRARMQYSMTEYTHEKIGYKATCTQWDGTNLEEIVSKFDDVNLWNGKLLIIRHYNTIETLALGDWVVTGENKYVKSYTNEQFNIKYKKIRGEHENIAQYFISCNSRTAVCIYCSRRKIKEN